MQLETFFHNLNLRLYDLSKEQKITIKMQKTDDFMRF